MEIRSFTTLYNNMKNWIIAKQNKLTDFNTGSVISSLVEAIAREIAQIYIRCRVGYDQFLSVLPYSIFKFYAKAGTYATGTVVFSRTAAILSETSIPAGTIVSAGEFTFSTTVTGSILSGQVNSSSLPVIATSFGYDYNVAQGQISVILSVLPSDIAAVTNTLKLTGGTDEETNAAFQNRFNEYIKGLSNTNLYGLKTGAKKSLLVRSVSVFEHFPPVDDIWNASVYVDDGTGYTSAQAIAEVVSTLNGDGTAANPGYRACGINIRVLAPTVVLIDLVFTIWTRQTESETAKDETTKVIREYINNLLIGEDVILSTLIITVRNIFYVVDVDISSPLENLIIGPTQIARFNSATITVVSE
jgi:uncharacterized phage protein gp47/JayE